MVNRFDVPPVGELNTAQLNGEECAFCPGRRDALTVPVGRVLGVQLRAHRDCAEENRSK